MYAMSARVMGDGRWAMDDVVGYSMQHAACSMHCYMLGSEYSSRSHYVAIQKPTAPGQQGFALRRLVSLDGAGSRG